jgi:hypothetical protein
MASLTDFAKNRVRDLARTVKSKTLDKTNLDERFINTARNVGQNLQYGARNITSPQAWNQNLSNLKLNTSSVRKNFEQNPLSNNKYLNSALNNSLNSGQSFMSGMEDVYKGVKTLNPFKAVTGVGRMAAPLTPLYQGANLAASQPFQLGTQPNLISPTQDPLPNRDQFRRTARGIMQGMSGLDDVGSNVKSQKSLQTPFGDFDPYMAAGSMYGFTQNPVNKQLFKITDKFFPSNGSVGKWITATATRGGLEEVFFAMADLPENASLDEKAKFVISQIPQGVLAEFVGQGISSGIARGSNISLNGLRQIDDITRISPFVKEQLAQTYDQLNKYRRYMTLPVKSTQIDEKTGQRVVQPLWKAIMTDQSGTFGGPGAEYFKEADAQFSSMLDKKPRFDSGGMASIDSSRLKLKPDQKVRVRTDKMPGEFDRSQFKGVMTGMSNQRLERLIGQDTAPIIKAVDPKNKVHLLDYLRTPEKVLKKLGLEKNAKHIQKKYADYLEDLPKEIDKVTQWYNKVGNSEDSSRRIFRWLDGKKDTTLSDAELEVAKEMKDYLAQWADKLNLPQEGRIANYITHIFEDDLMSKNFDPELAKIIADKMPGEVYNPFLLERLGQLGYVEDAFRALDAYVKRATRKYHMDQALTPLRRAVGKTAEESQLDLDSWQYVKQYVDNVNMRPQTVDRLFDDLIKSLPGGEAFGSRPTATVTRKIRQMIYRGTLGLNFGSALKNLTQGVNTYAELGEKYTAIGYTKAFRNIANQDPELKRILGDTFIQDRSLSAKKQLFQKIDKGLWVFFDIAEKINRASVYYGAKSKALSQGRTEQRAIDYATDMVRKTQFTFGSVDTPVAMQGDIAKTLLQFQSFNVKQAEYLTEMVSNKEFGKMARWLGANALIITAFGELLGMDMGDLIPSVRIGGSPFFRLASNTYQSLIDAPDKYGNDLDAEDKIRRFGNDLLPFIPAGIQIKKTYEGTKAVEEGEVTDKAGRTKFEVPNTTYNRIVGPVLGKYRTSEAQEYFDKKSGEANTSLLERLLKPDSVVEAAQEIPSVPTDPALMTSTYEKQKEIIDTLEQKRQEIQFDPQLDDDQKATKLENLEEKAANAQAFVGAMNPEQLQVVQKQQFETGLTRYSTGGSKNTEDRAAWAIEQFRRAQSPEELGDILEQMYDADVLSKTVVEQLREQYNLPLTQYTYGGERRNYNTSGARRKSAPKIKASPYKAPKATRISPVSTSFKVPNIKTPSLQTSGGLRVQPSNTIQISNIR